MRSRVFAAVFVALFAVSVRAQEFAQIGPADSGSVHTVNPHPVKDLSDKYFQGPYEAFENEVEKVLGPKATKPVLKFGAEWYLVIFAATPPNAKDPVLVMTVCHAGLKHPTTTLPGVGSFKEVFLAERDGAELGRVYAVTEDTNPLNADIIKFAQQVSIGAITSKLSRVRTLKPLTPTPPTPTLFYAVSEVTVPFPQATIVGKGAMTSPDISVNKLHDKADLLQNQLLLRKARISECAKKMAQDLADVVKKIPASDDPVTGQQRTDLATALDVQATLTLADTKCKDELLPNTPERAEKNAAVTEVQDAFQTLAAGDDQKRVEGDVTLHNVPRRLLSFGAIAGGMFAVHGDRAKVDSDKIAADPLSGSITLAAVNISLRRFDPTTVNATSPEKFRAFVGYVVTPEPGIGAGLSYLFFRGLSINAGAAQMLILKPKSKDDIGKAVVGAHPLKHGWGRALFIGFGYNF